MDHGQGDHSSHKMREKKFKMRENEELFNPK
jgi:hypothetical protein